MKLRSIASATVRVVLWTIMGVVLLALGIVIAVYSRWGQQMLRTSLLEKLNAKTGIEARIDDLRVRFPLRLDISGLMLVQNGDTVLKANTLAAHAALLPLLKGEVAVSKLALSEARFQMGNADSLMMMVIKADTLGIAPASVRLSPLEIKLNDGYIAHGLVSMDSKPDTSTVAKPAAESGELRINVKRLRLRDFTYQMSLLPSIDSLGATVGKGLVADASIDLKKQTVDIGGFTGSHLSAAYIAPDSAQIASVPVVAPSDTSSPPWTVSIDSICFDQSRGLYTTHGLQPMPGLDFAYIQADSMTLRVHNFYNQATTLSLPIELSATERCGVRLNAAGTFAMDSLKMNFNDFVLTTATTDLRASGTLGVGDMLTDPFLPMGLYANGWLGIPDLKLMFPAFDPYLACLRQDTPIDISADLSGTAGDLSITNVGLRINHCVSINATGRLRDAFMPYGPNGHLALSGNIIDVKGLVRDLLSGTGVQIPPMTLQGVANINNGTIDANLKANTLDGHLALDAKLAQTSEKYDLDLTTDQFPLNAFLPDMGIGRTTMNFKATGQGFDFFKPATHLQADASIASLPFDGYTYRGITLKATLADGQAQATAQCHSTDIDFTLRANGNLVGDEYKWAATVNADRADLKALKLMPERAILSLDLVADATYSPADNSLEANATLRNLSLAEEVLRYDLSDIKAHFMSNDSTMRMKLTNRDFIANAEVACSLDSISAYMGRFTSVLDHQLAEHQIYADTLQATLPKFSLYASAGANNFINDLLSPKDMDIRKLRIEAENTTKLTLNSQVINLRMQRTRLDSIGLNIEQKGNRMHLIAKVDNKPGTLDEWAHLRLDAIVNTNRISLRASQRNIQGQTGYDIGTILSMADSTAMARIFPLTPVIGYKDWTVNVDNYINYNIPHKHIDANLHMQGAKSSLALFTNHDAEHLSDSIDNNNDITLQIGNIAIQDWISINPFAPPLAGNLSANLHLLWDGNQEINGNGTVSFDDFYYNRQKVGNFLTSLSVATNASGMIKANLGLDIDQQRAATLTGCLNDSTAESPFNLDLSLNKFPLAIANPFFPPNVAKLAGTLNGHMGVSGDAAKPLLNGDIYFDQTAVTANMTNTAYTFSDVHIPVVNNLISFNDFGIRGTNDNPLLINGTVDMSSFTSPRIDLNLNAKNMMIVNSNRAARGANLFGKGYINLNADINGNMRFMAINADLTVLTGTNITYELTAGPSTLQAPTETDMVKFVNFSDSTAVVLADTIDTSSMLLAVDASVTLQTGTTITVDLGTSARDKATVQPTGTLNFTLSPASTEGRLTGRLNIDGGFVRYTLPVIGSEKQFEFNQGSYIAFNGDMLNPTLNVHAVDEVKTNVTSQGQNSRMVNFDILLGVTGTLNRMNVDFNLNTKDDITIANQLQAMSAEQRANQAMNLLLYNVYTGPGTTGNGNLSAGPLYSFLTSQINNWAANNIKGVDLSFGIDQYNQTTNGATSTAMNYSYQVSKTLFNDRFKIVVGGNYSTNDNTDENLSENLINDISLEYYLNSNHSMLLKLFRHTGYESILEGEVTQTGLAYVYRRKLNRLVQMLPRVFRPKKYRLIR